MQDRFKFLCGVEVCYYSDDGDDKKLIIRFEPNTIATNGYVGFYFDILIEKLKELGLSRHELDTAVDYIACNYETETENWCLAEPEYLVQCTGQKDKNSKLIYEGDIVEVTNLTKTYSLKTPVIWEKDIGAFMVWGNKEKSFGNYIGALMEEDEDGVVPYTVEVIGNIHENPELLE